MSVLQAGSLEASGSTAVGPVHEHPGVPGPLVFFGRAIATIWGNGKARAGLIPDFTGISSPYEEPMNSKKVDTTDRDIVECNEEILGMLTVEGWLTP